MKDQIYDFVNIDLTSWYADIYAIFVILTSFYFNFEY